MPDQTVQVTYDPNATPQFTFDPDTVVMTAAGKIKLQQHPANATWTFTGGSVQNDTLGNFSTDVGGNGNSLTFNDQCKDRTRTSYCYTVTISYNGQSITSPDPAIVNEPPVMK